jgi:phage shock protein A
MDGNGLAKAAVAVAVLALIVAVASLLSAPTEVAAQRVTPAPDARLTNEVTALQDSLKSCETSLGSTRQELAKIATRLAALEARTTEANETVAKPEIDTDMVRALLREEIQAQMDRFRGPGGDPRQQARGPEAIAERLGVDQETADKIAAIQQSVTEQVRDIWRENKGGDRDGNMRLMNEVREKVEAEIATLLTPEQMEMLRQMDPGAGRRPGGRGGRGGNRGGNRGNDAEPAAPAEDTPAF